MVAPPAADEEHEEEIHLGHCSQEWLQEMQRYFVPAAVLSSSPCDSQMGQIGARGAALDSGVAAGRQGF